MVSVMREPRRAVALRITAYDQLDELRRKLAYETGVNLTLASTVEVLLDVAGRNLGDTSDAVRRFSASSGG